MSSSGSDQRGFEESCILILLARKLSSISSQRNITNSALVWVMTMGVGANVWAAWTGVWSHWMEAVVVWLVAGALFLRTGGWLGQTGERSG